MCRIRPQAIAHLSADASDRKIVDTAGRLFRERGFDGVGVAELMAAAGFTHGGFYNHFPSKEALATVASSEGLRRSNERLAADLEREGLAAFRRYLEEYPSLRHRNHPDRGCTLSALPAAGRQARGRGKLRAWTS